jgi:hypothetical protein
MASPTRRAEIHPPPTASEFTVSHNPRNNDSREDFAPLSAEASGSTPSTAAESMPLLDGGWLSTEQLASRLNVDPSSLRRWRTARPPQGPPFVTISERVTLYSVRDVEEWLAQRRIDPRKVAA